MEIWGSGGTLQTLPLCLKSSGALAYCLLWLPRYKSSLIARRGRPDSVVLSPHFAVNFNGRLESPQATSQAPARNPSILPVIAVPGLLSFSSRLIVLVEGARVEEVGSSEVGSSGKVV